MRGIPCKISYLRIVHAYYLLLNCTLVAYVLLACSIPRDCCLLLTRVSSYARGSGMALATRACIIPRELHITCWSPLYVVSRARVSLENWSVSCVLVAQVTQFAAQSDNSRHLLPVSCTCAA